MQRSYTCKKQLMARPHQRWHGNVNRTIAMVSGPDFTPLVDCFIDHLDNIQLHRAIACPEFVVTMSSLEGSQVVIQEMLR